VRSAGSTFWSAYERHTVLREWNATARTVPGATLPELFAARLRAPDADAVVFEDERRAGEHLAMAVA
jgi:hypothetical protein